MMPIPITDERTPMQEQPDFFGGTATPITDPGLGNLFLDVLLGSDFPPYSPQAAQTVSAIVNGQETQSLATLGSNGPQLAYFSWSLPPHYFQERTKTCLLPKTDTAISIAISDPDFLAAQAENLQSYANLVTLPPSQAVQAFSRYLRMQSSHILSSTALNLIAMEKLSEQGLAANLYEAAFKDRDGNNLCPGQINEHLAHSDYGYVIAHRILDTGSSLNLF